jgi:glycosyltransferase involved in cell wall biosynthesis
VLAEDVDGLRLVIVLDGVELADPPAWTRDPRVSLRREPESRGPAAAMNAAIEQATTPYVARLDSDDVDLAGRLALEVGYLERHPEVVAVSSRTFRIDDAGTRTGTTRLPAGDDIRRHLLLSNVVPHSTLAFRRDAANTAGRYDPGFRQMEDFDFILRLAALGPIAQLAEPLVEYRVHATQTSRGARPSGPHIAAVRRGRERLAAVLGVNPLRARAEHLVWLTAQRLRWWGLVRPGHER